MDKRRRRRRDKRDRPSVNVIVSSRSTERGNKNRKFYRSANGKFQTGKESEFRQELK